ncbi:hypothetical protein CROQUDRAFT_98797 [Cronartium quercuum f. sp. fusiforme G11]|uniref:Uncharacterized protein n=1 Tax=Cronartium quercuum f. sp. fusiforme G11 TaxID=708437 RepID=A0A9P6T8E6_9BASI|nr:hypothetical protein CROQUDRAFT_98797 [Cronartium quercuum f. sp. fusiforme G11]
MTGKCTLALPKVVNTDRQRVGNNTGQIDNLLSIHLASTANALETLATVNRKIYNLYRPVLWKNLIFPTCLPRQTNSWLESIIPKKGHLVQRLTLGICMNQDAIGNQSSPLSWPTVPYENASRGSNTRITQMDNSISLIEVVIPLINQLPQLQSFTCDKLAEKINPSPVDKSLGFHLSRLRHLSQLVINGLEVESVEESYTSRETSLPLQPNMLYRFLDLTGSNLTTLSLNFQHSRLNFEEIHNHFVLPVLFKLEFMCQQSSVLAIFHKIVELYNPWTTLVAIGSTGVM